MEKITEYHCMKCDVYFKEEGTPPNINKRHGCGEFVKIIEHRGESSEAGSEG